MKSEKIRVVVIACAFVRLTVNRKTNPPDTTTVRRMCHFRFFFQLNYYWHAFGLQITCVSKAMPPCRYRCWHPLKPKPASVGKRFKLSNLNGGWNSRYSIQISLEHCTSVVSDINYTVISEHRSIIVLYSKQ